MLNDLANSKKKISEQIIEIYDRLFSFPVFDKNEINKFNFFVKEIRDFENIFGENFNSRLVDIILQIEKTGLKKSEMWS